MPAQAPDAAQPEQPILEWQEEGRARRARWRSEAGLPPPPRVEVVSDEISADAAWRLACEGTAMLWRGDFQNARQLLQAIGRRIDRKPQKKSRKPLTPAEHFHRYRMAQSQRARLLGMLLLPFAEGFTIPLRRAPEVVAACAEAWGGDDAPCVVSLRELQGVIGAHEWRKRGVEVPALKARIHPHYGVFSPLRGEYVDLVARAPLPAGAALAFDIGTGSGVLAALLARRGVERVVATECSARAMVCAADNLSRLGIAGQVELQQADLFPEGRAPLIVCNPPWLPTRPTSPLEQAIYDPQSRMLRGFLAGLPAHLADRGEAWLVLSDLAEHLGLRSREQLLEWVAEAGLEVIDRDEIRPSHRKAADEADALHQARAAEVTTLWRLSRRA